MSKQTNEKKFRIDISNTKNITHDDTWETVSDTFIRENGFDGFIMNSWNDFYEHGISEIMCDTFKDVTVNINNARDKTVLDRKIKNIKVVMNFSNIKIHKARSTQFTSGRESPIYPIQAHRQDKSYLSAFNADIHIKATAYLKNGTEMVRETTISDYRISRIFCAVGSKYCNTYGKEGKALEDLKQDPLAPKGAVLSGGRFWVLNTRGSTCYNYPRIFNNRWANELQRCEFISKPGDTYQNSKQIIIRYLDSGALTIEFGTPKLSKIEFPFYVVYRLFGWTNDKEIVDNIILKSAGVIETDDIGIDDDDILSKRMLEILQHSFTAKYESKRSKFGNMTYMYDEIDIKERIARKYGDAVNRGADMDDPVELHQTIKSFMETIDEDFLPHVGLTHEYRHKKLKYLSYLIRQILLTNVGVLPPTDRDSSNIKRFFTPGITCSKLFKTAWSAVLMGVRKQFLYYFKNLQFDKVNLDRSFRTSLNRTEFTRITEQAIKSGNKAPISISKNKRIENRVSTQLWDEKNQLKAISMLRMVVPSSIGSGASSKTSSRSFSQRMPHASMMGFSCVIQSSDSGDKIGLYRQVTVASSITSYGNSEFFKQYLLDDPMVIKPGDIKSQEDTLEMFMVMVNGSIVGYVKNSFAMINKYTELRRACKIYTEVSIEWDTDRRLVQFWLDFGRQIRPVLIVYNNVRDWKKLGLSRPPSAVNEKKVFKQGIAITPEILKGIYERKYKMIDLLKMGVIEYLTPPEQQRMLVSCSIENLQKHENSILTQYTHCDVPENLLGVAALVSPLANYNQTTRNTYQGAQALQTGGIYSSAWPYRIDKDTFIQYRVTNPLVTTRINRYIRPNGHMSIVAVMCQDGYNIEDGIIFNKQLGESGMFNGSSFGFTKAVLEKNEKITIPDAKNTIGIKKYANYSKLGSDGMVQLGDVVYKGDVLIGKVKSLPKNIAAERKAKFLDQSILYKGDHPAIINSKIEGKDDDANMIYKISYRKFKPPIIGNKYSSRSAQKSVVCMIYRSSDMPFTENGLQPHMIMNPAAYPTRMTMSQPIEQALSIIAATRGVTIEGDIFRKIDLTKVQSDLVECGYHKSGKTRLYDGITGSWIDSEIYIGPTYYQLLQKFVEKQMYVSSVGKIDILTRQPLDGKANQGGIKISELLKDAITSHGSMSVLMSKFIYDSDRFDVYVCRCGTKAIVNQYKNIFDCPNCGEDADINVISSTWSSKLLFQELEAMHIGVKVSLEPFKFYD
jgi:DNA-directed RNA polymerase beta subunit